MDGNRGAATQNRNCLDSLLLVAEEWLIKGEGSLGELWFFKFIFSCVSEDAGFFPSSPFKMLPFKAKQNTRYFKRKEPQTNLGSHWPVIEALFKHYTKPLFERRTQFNSNIDIQQNSHTPGPLLFWTTVAHIFQIAMTMLSERFWVLQSK